eukprot:1134248-Pelagomonas_calceolata.AAC.1
MGMNWVGPSVTACHRRPLEASEMLPTYGDSKRTRLRRKWQDADLTCLGINRDSINSCAFTKCCTFVQILATKRVGGGLAGRVGGLRNPPTSLDALTHPDPGSPQISLPSANTSVMPWKQNRQDGVGWNAYHLAHTALVLTKVFSAEMCLCEP